MVKKIETSRYLAITEGNVQMLFLQLQYYFDRNVVRDRELIK